jgi:hypothetical protein
MYIGLQVKHPLFLSEFNGTYTPTTDFSKNTKVSSFMKIHPLGAVLFHAERQTKHS